MVDATQARASISAATLTTAPIPAIHLAKHPHPNAEETGKDSKHLIERQVNENHPSRYLSEDGRCSILKPKIVAVTAIACARQNGSVQICLSFRPYDTAANEHYNELANVTYPSGGRNH